MYFVDIYLICKKNPIYLICSFVLSNFDQSRKRREATQHEHQGRKPGKQERTSTYIFLSTFKRPKGFSVCHELSLIPADYPFMLSRCSLIYCRSKMRHDTSGETWRYSQTSISFNSIISMSGV